MKARKGMLRKSARQIATERAEARSNALEVLCRVFDDGADVAIQEWEAWYDPTRWFHWSRALGAFIHTRLEQEPVYQRGVRAGLQQAIRLINAAEMPPEGR